MIRGFVKNILKPIIAEAIAEVGAEVAQKSEKRYYTREEACGKAARAGPPAPPGLDPFCRN